MLIGQWCLAFFNLARFYHTIQQRLSPQRSSICLGDWERQYWHEDRTLRASTTLVSRICELSCKGHFKSEDAVWERLSRLSKVARKNTAEVSNWRWGVSRAHITMAPKSSIQISFTYLTIYKLKFELKLVTVQQWQPLGTVLSVGCPMFQVGNTSQAWYYCWTYKQLHKSSIHQIRPLNCISSPSIYTAKSCFSTLHSCGYVQHCLSLSLPEYPLDLCCLLGCVLYGQFSVESDSHDTPLDREPEPRPAKQCPVKIKCQDTARRSDTNSWRHWSFQLLMHCLGNHVKRVLPYGLAILKATYVIQVATLEEMSFRCFCL